MNTGTARLRMTLIGVCAAVGLFAATPIRAAADPLDAASRQRVTIPAGDVVLGATLFRPGGSAGDLPAVVTAHGSAPTDRDGVGFYTSRALLMGFAVLSFDKRGVGESTGEYVPFEVSSSRRVFEQLANDVVHCVRWLAGQDGVDKNRIGLFGGSQAGWIMPLAASREPLVKFIIVGEGAVTTAGEEAIHGEVGGDGTGWNRETIAKADAALRAYDGDPGYDPFPVLQRLEVPTLWLLGLRDDVIPVETSLARLQALIQDGKTNNYVHVFPFGDHNFMNTARGERYDVTGVAERWLRQIGILE